MNESVDFYCERCSDALWAEPLNALSNVSFLVAAALAYRLARRSSRLTGTVFAMIVLACLVGFGSFVFHTFATRATQVMDILPIFVFQVYFLWLYLVRFLAWNRLAATVGCIGFLIANIAMLGLPRWLNGSMIYAPTYVLIGAMTVYHQISRLPAAGWMVTLLTGFSLSLCCRTIDMAVCQAWPVGTHFLWHLVNGVVLFASIRVVMECEAQPLASAGDSAA
ncbi:ceramidase domain-containing protein [Rubripirellula reticaptiva]|uniref:Ceramidase n=1 Tax=Rubripirellula reticaptiva TaxID=2528013 RepID=A0A5C6F559_9BACT|nr:ceramidase domain-containing protein [Rubripirellula reticaptiva]TWU55644.1 Ceramidase [Rubripirellula reticaptiva]